MPVEQPFNIYQEQLTSLYHGLALWRPNPVEDIYDQVSIGDVGYISEGAFIRMFNVTLPWDDESNRKLGEPERYNPLTFTGTRIDRETFDQVDYYSRRVSREENAGNIQASSPEQDEGVTYKCRGRGALLYLPHGGRREIAIQRKVFEKYIRDHAVSWFNWSRDKGLPVERTEDLVLVYGCTLVTSWAAAAFDDYDTDAQLSLTSRVLDNGGTSFCWSNIRGTVEYRNNQLDPNSPHTRKNHCASIKCFRAKRILFWTRHLRAAAEPLPDDLDNSQGGEMQVTQGPDASKVGSLLPTRGGGERRVTPWLQYRDPLITVLDYIVEKCLEDDIDTAEDNMAITRHDDLWLFKDVEVLSADAVEQFLSENDMPLFIADGATMLRHSLWQVDEREKTDKRTSPEANTIDCGRVSAFVIPSLLSLLPSLFDRAPSRAHNPYMARPLQHGFLNLDPGEFALLNPLPDPPSSNVGLIDDAHGPVITNTGAGHDVADELVNDIDDNLDDNASDSLHSIEDYEYPSFFSQRGSPPRLFHSYGTYALPVDGDEGKREESQHVLLRMILGSNYDAPIHELLNDNSCKRKVVDLCTGAGHWVLEMANEFPLVEFRGLDLVPRQTRYPPRNVRFEIADVTERLRFADGSVDVVHTRMACLRAEVVPRFLQEVTRVLRPGGLFLSADWGVHPTLHPEHPFFADSDAYIPKAVSFYKAASEIVPSLAPQILRLIGQTASFEEPVSKLRAIPISTPYTPNSTPSPAVAFVSQVMGRITQGYAAALMAGGFLLQEDADAFKDELDRRFGICITYQTIFARKKSSG